MKKIIFALAVISLIMLIPGSAKTESINLSLCDGMYGLSFSVSPSLIVSDVTDTGDLLTRRTVSMENGLKIILYKIFNGDTVYFIQYRPVSRADVLLKLETGFDPGTTEIRHIGYEKDFAIEDSYWISNIVNSGSLPRATVYAGNMLLSLVDVFTETASDTLQENYLFSPAFHVDRTKKGGGRYTVILPGVTGKLVSHWGVLSNKPLVDWEYEKTDEQIRLADLNRARKLLPWGFMDKTPPTYVPSGEDIFWWNPSQFVGDAFVRHDENRNRVFTDISLVALYQLIGRQNSHGFWYSSPVSEWLKEDYGIGGYFYDTRFCTNAGMFLLNAYEKYGEPEALHAAGKYAAYVVNHIKRGKKTASGVLSPDYWSEPGFQKAIHTSLNHQLAQMNFLYGIFLITGNEEYKNSAVLLKNGIRDTGRGWVKENGDLWYCINNSGGYEKDDYKTLTLYDLINSKTLIRQAEGRDDEMVELLRASKYAYAKKNGHINW